MTAYEIMLKTNRYMIRGGEYSDAEKIGIAQQLHQNRITDGKMRVAPYSYPKFFIPPYNSGKALPTIIPMSAKTFQVGDNAYEFEILRLIRMFATEEEDELSNMLDVTSERLKHTCFGYKSCGDCECFEASIVVLRYLTFAEPNNTSWIEKQLAIYHKHFADKRRSAGVQRYFWLCLSNMPFDIAEGEIKKQRENILTQLRQSHKIKGEHDDINLYVMRNTLARLPEFSYLSNRKPYEQAGQLHFSLS